MRILSIIILGFGLSNCRKEASNEKANPCHEFTTPENWICSERINYEFCFPEVYQSDMYRFSRDEPYAYLSKGVWNGPNIQDVDPSQFVSIPFPEEIDLTESNAFTEKIEICDSGDIIGVFYYGNVIFDNFSPYGGYLYLQEDVSNPKFYLSGIAEASKEGMDDLLKSIIRIRRK